MTREELIARCRKAPNVGTVKHEDYVDYITVIERRRRSGQGWGTEGTPYMSVDGRLAMANEDHRQQGKKLNFENPVIMADSEEQLTLMVVVDSEIYGRRHGIATSRKVDGAPIETQHPWEIAETSAIGRALAAMGYGLLPGTGLASSEDMIRSGERPAPTTPDRLSERQQTYLVNEYSRKHGVGADEALAALNKLCRERYGQDLDQCAQAQGREISLGLRQLPNAGRRTAGDEAA